MPLLLLVSTAIDDATKPSLPLVMACSSNRVELGVVFAEKNDSRG